MAPFNPTPQPVSPGTYVDLSKPIQQPEPDVSAATAIKGFGTSLGLAVEAADQGVKQVVQDMVYGVADKTRNDFTQNLVNAKDAVLKGLGNTLGIKSDAPEDIPTSLQSGLDDVASIESANGKISSTAYWGKLTNTTKQLRAMFPGYREFIDEQVSKITGHNPANAYMNSLIQDLNRSAAGNKDDFNKKTEGMFFQENIRDLPGAAEELMRARRTGDWAGAYKWVNDQRSWKGTTDKKNAEITAGNLERGAKERATYDAGQVAAGNLVQGALDSLVVNIPGYPDNSKLRDVINDLQLHPEKLKQAGGEELGNKLASTLASAQNKAFASIDKTFNDKIEGTDETMSSRMGEDNRTKIKNGMKTVFDQNMALITSEQFGIANASRVYNRSVINDTTRNLLQEKSTAEFTRKAMVERQVLGDQAMATLMTEYYGGTAPDAFKTYIHSQTQDMIVQSDLQTSGQIKTFDDVLEHAKNHNIGSPTRPDGSEKSPAEKKAEAETIGKIVKKVNIIDMPQAGEEAKLNIARAAYSPGKNNSNWSMINRFVIENRDPISGETKPGQHSVYDMYFGESKTAEVKQLSKRDPSLWDNYVTAGTQAWKLLFNNDIRQMNDLSFSGAVKIGWDTDNHRWAEPVLDMRKARDLGLVSGGQTELLIAKETVGRVNKSLANMQKIGEVSGFDPNSFLLRSFLDAGVNPKNMPVSMTTELYKAMVLGNTPQPDGSQSPANDSGSRKTEAPVPTPRAAKNNASASDSGGPILHYNDPQYGPISGTIKDWIKALTPSQPTPEDTNKIKSKLQERLNYAGSR